MNHWDLERQVGDVVYCDPLNVAPENAETYMLQQPQARDSLSPDYKNKSSSSRKRRRTPAKKPLPFKKPAPPSSAATKTASKSPKKQIRTSTRRAAVSARAEIRRAVEEQEEAEERAKRRDKRKRRRAARSVISSSSSSTTDRTPSSSRNRSGGGDGDDSWDEKECDALIVAHRRATPNGFFWNSVAEGMPNRSARECAEKYKKLFATPKSRGTGRRRARDAAGASGGSEKKAKLLRTLALGKGRAPTKRLQAYREVLQMADAKHGADDYFETPQRKGTRAVRRGSGARSGTAATPSTARKAESQATPDSFGVASPPDIAESPFAYPDSASGARRGDGSPDGRFVSVGSLLDAAPDRHRTDRHIQKLKKSIRSGRHQDRRIAAKKRRRAKRAKRKGIEIAEEEEPDNNIGNIQQRLGNNLIHNDSQPLRAVRSGADGFDDGSSSSAEEGFGDEDDEEEFST